MSQSFLIACENGNRKIAELLLEQEVSDVNYADEKGRTALHYAAHRGYRAICEALIAKGADINYEDHNGETPLFFATLQDRKSTRLNSSHVKISYAVFCLKKTTA